MTDKKQKTNWTTVGVTLGIITAIVIGTVAWFGLIHILGTAA